MKYAVFDIESTEWVNFQIMGFYTGEEYKTFASPKSFIKELNQKKYKGWRIYAHSGGTFDFKFLLEELYNLTNDVRLIERGGRIIAIYVTTEKTKFTLADSYALLPSSLHALCEFFKTEHQKQKFDFKAKKFDKKNKRDMEYLMYDCMALYEVLTSFFESDFCGTPQLTTASQALNIFRTRFLECDLFRVRDKYEYMFKKNFYSGGRVEVYKGSGTVHHFDVNSLYPYAMLGDMPCGRLKETKTYDKSLIGFWCIEILNTPDWYISPLLFKKEKRNYFVNGPGTYYLSSDTINYLVKEFGIKFKVVFGFTFSGREPLFNEYVSYFYGLKTKVKQEMGSHDKDGNANAGVYYISKLMLNSLYGKLGQTRIRESVEPYNGQEVFSEFATGNSFSLVLVKHESRSEFILPYLAAYITERARLYHFKIMHSVAKDVFYCDTDSIMCSTDSLKSKVSDKIGWLSYTGKYKGIFLAGKTYALKDEKGNESITFKGFDSEDFTFRKFEKILEKYGEEGTELVGKPKERMLSFRECFTRKSGIIREKNQFLKVVMTQKTAKPSIENRTVIPSRKFGFDTKPFNQSDV
jgi:DNA polymerase elongation subunit (family B)